MNAQFYVHDFFYFLASYPLRKKYFLYRFIQGFMPQSNITI